ncbi:GNAT family N-acetyltransferase [Methanothermobacter sp.]|uniref:GNAT family N-acetyltransferase n=1 Tax=Methanothermobacter sp. TaxID=1884223 RepID=UPI00260F9619|nr:GNAT family N-acetyltransferase [Methanothermobacter sp.]MDI9618374.1 GNAT family N-acetyltransferase [Methanothermobacter sp.]
MVVDIILVTIPQTESEIESIRRFLFDMIRREFGYGYIPDYHRDIIEFREHYLNPPGNTFISASLGGKVIGTLGLRAYDREFEGLSYDPDTTAGLWRVFVHEDYRRRGIASLLVGIAEAHAARMGYRRMYLHTHKHVGGALEFWLSMGYRVTLDTGNELNTVHMEKPLKPPESADKVRTIHTQKPFKTQRVLQY